MNLVRITSRLAVGGVTAALATAGLVGVTSVSATAAPVSTTYNCSAAGQTFPVPVSVDIALLPATAPAGFPVPAGLLSFNSTVTVPDAVQQLLNATNNTGAKSDDFGTSFGTNVAKAPVAWTKPAAATNGVWVYTGKGSNAAFTLPKAGTYSVNMPTTFTLVTTGGTTPVTATCTAAATPAQIGSITLSKQASTTKAKAPKSIKKGAVASVKVTVINENSKAGGVIPSGKLIIKDGKKTVGKGKLDAKGKATIKVKGLAAGSHKLVVIYKGDDFDNGSKSKAVKVIVKG